MDILSNNTSKQERVSMDKYIHISELLKGSSAYDDIKGMSNVSVVIKEDVSYVSYTFEGKKWIDVWRCENGQVYIYRCGEPTEWYNEGDEGYEPLRALLNL